MKVILYQTAIADYRDKFIQELVSFFDVSGHELEINTGLQYFEESTITSQTVLEQRETRVVKNLFLFNRRILVQLYNPVRALRADVVVLELNPRIINVSILLLLRWLLRRRTVVWGHAWPRAGRGAPTDQLRSYFRGFASAILVYTESQRNELIVSGCRRPIYVAPNSLYKLNEFTNVYSELSTSILYVGRLVASKKVHLLIEAFSRVVRDGVDCTLHVVGAGPELERLQVLSRELGLSDGCIVFHGHINDMSYLKGLYSNSFVSVSPGYVGLSITQSLSFAVPMIVADNEAHSPELEALKPGFNGDFFKSNDSKSLANMILRYYSGRNSYALRASDVVKDCQARYSVEVMVRGFYDSSTAE